MPALVLALGAGSILLLLANNWIQQRLIAPDVGSLRAVASIQTRVTVTHLWIEEYVTGDQVELAEIDRSLAQAARLVDALEARDFGEADGGPASTNKIRASVSRIAAGVRHFASLTDQRREGADRGEEVGIGSPVDVEYENSTRHKLMIIFGPDGTVADYTYERKETPSKRVY